MDENSKKSDLKIEINGQDPKENAPSVQTACVLSSWESQYNWQATM